MTPYQRYLQGAPVHAPFTRRAGQYRGASRASSSSSTGSRPRYTDNGAVLASAAPNNGSVPAVPSEEKQPQVKMYVASGEDLPLPLKLSPGWADGASPSLTVAPPRQRMGSAASAVAAPAVSPARNGARHERHLQRMDSGEGARLARQQQDASAGATRALKAELSVNRVELKAKASELSQAQVSLRGKDREVAMLRAALVERDSRLAAGKGELLRAQQELQDKDAELHAAYERLTQACQQRSSVRAALIGTQTELAEAAAELEAWTHEMAAFQDIVDAAGEVEQEAVAGNGAANSKPRGPAAAGGGGGSKGSSRSKKAEKRSNEVDSMMSLLKDLSMLSDTLVEDAKEDDELFRKEA